MKKLGTPIGSEPGSENENGEFDPVEIDPVEIPVDVVVDELVGEELVAVLLVVVLFGLFVLVFFAFELPPDLPCLPDDREPPEWCTALPGFVEGLPVD
jgi:hypothetical protein